MQQVADRQKTLTAHRALISDERLPLAVTSLRDIKELDGRILGHGEDEGGGGRNFGRHYMLFEGVDGKIHLIYYTPTLEEARSRGDLATNSFVQLRKRFENGRPMLEVSSMGNVEQLLKNDSFFRQKARGFGNPDAVINQEVWGGWLRRYRTRLASAPTHLRQRGSIETER